MKEGPWFPGTGLYHSYLNAISVYSKQVGCFLDGDSFFSLLEDLLLEAHCLLEKSTVHQWKCRPGRVCPPAGATGGSRETRFTGGQRGSGGGTEANLEKSGEFLKNV